MAKRPASTFSNADARPRVYFRHRDGRLEVAGNGAGPWHRTTGDLLEGIDMICGDGAWRGSAVIFWEGSNEEGNV